MKRQAPHYTATARKLGLTWLLVLGGFTTETYGQQPSEHEDHADHVSAEAAATGPLTIELASGPEALQAGKNLVSVSVTQADGTPVDDAEVTMVFSMPAMPTMNMPAMNSTFVLAPQGTGTYEGEGELMMGGTWNVTINVVKGGTKLGTRKLSVVAAE